MATQPDLLKFASEPRKVFIWVVRWGEMSIKKLSDYTPGPWWPPPTTTTTTTTLTLTPNKNYTNSLPRTFTLPHPPSPSSVCPCGGRHKSENRKTIDSLEFPNNSIWVWTRWVERYSEFDGDAATSEQLFFLQCNIFFFETSLSDRTSEWLTNGRWRRKRDRNSKPVLSKVMPKEEKLRWSRVFEIARINSELLAAIEA